MVQRSHIIGVHTTTRGLFSLLERHACIPPDLSGRDWLAGREREPAGPMPPRCGLKRRTARMRIPAQPTPDVVRIPGEVNSSRLRPTGGLSTKAPRVLEIKDEPQRPTYQGRCSSRP
jgi:hypothetical protein